MMMDIIMVVVVVVTMEMMMVATIMGEVIAAYIIKIYFLI